MRVLLTRLGLSVSLSELAPSYVVRKRTPVIRAYLVQIHKDFNLLLNSMGEKTQRKFLLIPFEDDRAGADLNSLHCLKCEVNSGVFLCSRSRDFPL